MLSVPCPVSEPTLRRYYVENRLTDKKIASLIGGGATPKRVASWRKRLGIETLRRVDRVDVPAIEGRLRSILVGSMLGDGRLSRTSNAARFQENHSEAQREYLAWKILEWGPWVRDGMRPVEWRRPEGSFQGWRFHTTSHPSLNEWHSLFYDAQGPKRLDPKVVEFVDELALSVWFMDDGSVGWWPRITFGMDARSHAVARTIFNRHGFHPRWEPHKGNSGDFIFNGHSQARAFVELIRPNVPVCMARKLIFGFQGR